MLIDDVSNKFSYLILMGKKQNSGNFESMYKQKPQIAVAGTKHTMVTNTNKILHKKIASKS